MEDNNLNKTPESGENTADGGMSGGENTEDTITEVAEAQRTPEEELPTVPEVPDVGGRIPNQIGESEPVPAQAPPVQRPEYVYNWNASESREKQEKVKKKKSSRGIAVYAVIMSAAFLVAILLLVLVLFFPNAVSGGKVYIERNVYVHDRDEIGATMSVQEIVDFSCPYTVTIYSKKQLGASIGTGIFLSSNGYIATNYHVVNEAESVTVCVYNEERSCLNSEYRYTARIIAYDEEQDLALLRITSKNGETFKAAEIGDVNSVMTGDKVVAIGTPYSLNYAWSATVGYISCALRTISYGTNSITMIQTDTAVNPGNSGGPLINDEGKVIGIVSQKISASTSNGTVFEGMGLAIPISTVYEFFQKNIEADMGKPEIGIKGVDIAKGERIFALGDVVYYVRTDETGDYYVKDSNKVYLTGQETEGKYVEVLYDGWLILQIESDSDANGKLQLLDVIVELDGTALVYDTDNTPYDIIKNLLDTKTDMDTVTVKYLRDGAVGAVEVGLKSKG